MIRQFYQFCTLALFCGMLFGQCICDPGITFNPPLQTPIAISFLDANKLLDEQVPNVRVTILDPGKSIVTVNGLPVSTIEIEGGVMCLGSKEGTVPNDSTPYHFTIIAEAAGYVTTYRDILLNKTDKPYYYFPIYLTKLDDPGPGMASGSGQYPISQGVNKDTFLMIPKNLNGLKNPDGSDQALPQVVVLPGTTFLRNHLPVSGDSLQYRVVYAAGNSATGARTFPGGSMITNARDLKTNEILATPKKPAYLESVGWITLEMQANGGEVDSFSRPVNVTLPIPDGLPNPDNNYKPYQANDIIWLWSLDRQGLWTQNTGVSIKEGANGLEANFRITHLSTWSLGFLTGACASDITISYTNHTGSNRSLYTELIDALTGKPFPAITESIEYLTSGGVFTISNAPENKTLSFVVYNTPTAPATKAGIVQNTFGKFTSCNSPAQPIDIADSASINTVKMSFEVVSNGTTYNPVCGNAVWYKFCNTCDDLEVSSSDASGEIDSSLYCATLPGAYNFGGVAVPVTSGDAALAASTQSDITLSQPVTPFEKLDSSIYCMRLWYGGFDAAGNTVSETIDFPINFRNTSSGNETIHGQKRVNNSGAPIPVTITHFFDNTEKMHRIRITNGITTLAGCRRPLKLMNTQ